MALPVQIHSPSFPHPTFSSSGHRNRIHSRIRVRSQVSENSELASHNRLETVATARGGIRGPERDSQVEKSEELISEQLGLMYDDGYGTHSVVDYLGAAREMVRPDGGPPRWFCPVDCGRPIDGSPLLLFLPGNGYGT